MATLPEPRTNPVRLTTAAASISLVSAVMKELTRGDVNPPKDEDVVDLVTAAIMAELGV